MALLSLNSNKLHHNLRAPPPSPFTTPEFGPNLAISKSKMGGWGGGDGGGVAKGSISFCNLQHLEKTPEVYRGWGGQFSWQIKAVSHPNVFAGWTHLIPEHRSDMLGTKMGPHMQTPQTRSPGASKKPLVPVYLFKYGNLMGGTLKRAETQSAFFLSNMKQQRRTNRWGGGWGGRPRHNNSGRGSYI